MRLAETVTFGGTGRERGHGLRGDAAAQARLWQAGLVLALWRGRVLVAPQGLGWLSPDHPLLEGATGRVFLGLHHGQGMFAVDLSAWEPGAAPLETVLDAGSQPHPLAPEGHVFGELRAVMAALSPDEAEMAATARALVEWHRSHGFCPRCGAATEARQAGWHRHCPACGTEHFPRTDPVVIMLVTRGNDVLLGRSPHWPEGMYSLLAGFVEPGETVEAAVRREVAEEAGIPCGRVDYLASQPWPFPASLMLGCRTEALGSDITLDPVELEDALWVSREEAVGILAGSHPRIRQPRKGAIAQFLLANWLADRLD